MKKLIIALALIIACAVPAYAQSAPAVAPANTVQMLTQRQTSTTKMITVLTAKLTTAQAALALSQTADSGAVLSVAQVDSISAVLANVPFTSAGQALTTTQKLQAVVNQLTANIARANTMLSNIGNAITLLNSGTTITAAQLTSIESLLN
jgi:hypothetical protein